MEVDDCVAVTHFINPHLFWYKTIDTAPDTKFYVLSHLEERLSELYKNKPYDNLLRPQIGDKVAINFIAWNKFIRAEILQKAEFQHEHYILWAIDYGFPLLSKKEYLRNLPTELHGDIGNVHIGGIIDIYPAEQEYDDMEGNLVMISKDNWLQRACDMLEKLLADANSISFHKRFQIENGHVWGDLTVVNHRGIEINAREYLLKTTNAIQVNEMSFKENCSMLKTIKIAKWLTNDRSPKIKINNIKHNYIEHAKQMNAALIDENAKRKVEDWQERNERKRIESSSDLFEPNIEEHCDDANNIEFDDSVSVTHTQDINYMGKAGIMTKIKLQKYSSETDLPPSALSMCFEIDGMRSNVNFPTETRNLHSSHSDATEKNIKDDIHIRNSDLSNIHQEVGPLIDLGSTASTNISSSKRREILLEMRKKVARAQKEKQNESKVWKPMDNLRGNTNSITSGSKTSDIHVEQSLTLSTLNKATNDKFQDNESDLSVKNRRVKQLIAMRKKIGSITSLNDKSLENATRKSQYSASPQQGSSNASETQPLIALDVELEPKSDDKIEPPPIFSSSSSSKNTVNEILKLKQSGYNSFTMVPAGYDITRLGTYKNEENHWHRKKSTRYDYVPHEQTSSIEDVLSNNTNDKSFSPSDLFQTKSIKKLSQSSNNPTNYSNEEDSINDENEKECSQQLKQIGVNNLSNEPSTSSSSYVRSQKPPKRRQLKSPTSQLLKIDKILHEYSVEKELGHENIILNTSSNYQNSALTNMPSKVSSNNINIPIIAKSSNINSSYSLTSSHTDNSRNEKVNKDILNYEALLDVKRTEYLPIVEGERKIQTKFIEHLVLAHSSVQLTPIENIAEAPFLPEIHEEMRQMRVNKVYRIQVYSWSHVLRNNSLFVVNPPRSGKTWSYLPPLCSLLCCRKNSYKSSYGPVAIILVASLKHVELINNYCRRLMNGLKAEAPTCIPSYGIRNLIETKVHLLNGCGILIATPSNVLRLLLENENEPLFDPERLQHIVIDDMDIMMSRSQQDFEKACSILFKMAKASSLKKLSPQLIVTSRDWDGLMVKFIQKSNQPLLLIGDFLEAAVYGHATLSIKLKLNTEKNDTIITFIKQISESAQGWANRTLILCNDNDDVQNVSKFLRSCGYPCLSYDSRSTENERVTIDEWKKKVSSQILVCTDASFCTLKIQNVNNLIHYSLPTSWTQFTFRFSAFVQTYNNYVCYFEHSTLPTTSTVRKNSAHSLILLDENNNLQLPRLVDFMRKHKQIVRDEIQEVAKRILVMREDQRILSATPLCPQILEFGECDEVRCDNRHELTRFDVIKQSDGIPSSGEIRIHVLKVFSPTYYAVRLIQHKLPNVKKWVESRRSSESLTFSIQLNMHYQNDSNLFLHWPPHVNDLCIYQYSENFRRARILEVPTLKENSINVVQSNLKVTIRLIDDGVVISSVKCNEIYVCDDKFKEFPPQAVDVRLMRVVPFDNERSWDSKTTRQVQKWIIEELQPNYIVQASIEFSLTNTIWVKNLVVLEKLNGIDAYCPVVDLKKSLIVKKFGVLYNGDRKHVRDLAKEYELLNCTECDIDNDESDIDYQSCDNESINLIRFSSSNDEDTINSMESSGTCLEETKEIEKNATESIVEAKEPNAEGEGDWDDNLNCSQQLDETSIPIEEKIVGNDINNLKKESWSKIPLNELVKVEIGDEGENGNWESIFFQVIDKNSIYFFQEMNNLINRHVEEIKSNKEKQKKIYDFEPLHNCIVRYNNLYLRAKVCGVYGGNMEQRLYRFFLCDYACFTNAKINELYDDFLYETTEEIINFTPYQAIHCTLAGIKWDKWSKRYQVTKEYLYACAVSESSFEEKSNLHNLPIQSYRILLYECENENEFTNAILFNKVLVDNGITIFDENTENFLQYEISIAKCDESIVPNTAINNQKPNDTPKTYNKYEVLTFEQLIEFINSNAFENKLDDMTINKDEIKALKSNASEMETRETRTSKSLNEFKTAKSDNVEMNEILKEKSIAATSESEIDEEGHCTSHSNSSVKSSISITSINSELELSTSATPPLKVLHKRPQTTWYQNDCMVFISIYAPDVKDYFLEITSEIVLFSAEIQSEKSVLILKLLASIDPEKVSHEIKGVNVIIRLKKNVFIKWPRLLKEPTKYYWLNYNFNTFDSNDMEYIMPEQLLHRILDNELNFESKRVDYYNSDDDNEREVYQTYNPIQDNEDDCDPFSF